MSFAEFQIRLFAYKRVQLREWEKVRAVCWYAMKGSHLDPKSMPKTLEQFMKLAIDKTSSSKITDTQKQAFLIAMQDYQKQIKNKA